MLIQKIDFQLSVIHVLFLSVLEKFAHVVFDQKGTSKDAHDLEDGSVQLEVVLDDGNETVRDDGDVDLYAHSILGLAPEPFDAEMLFDPFEEKFHLPAVAVKQCDVLGREIEVIGVVNERTSEVSCIINDSSDLRRIVVEIAFASETDGLVKEHTILSIKKVLARKDLIFRLSLFPYDEESLAQMDGEKPCKVEIAPVKHVAGRRLIGDAVHEFRVVDSGVCDSIEDRDFSGDVDLCMDPDAGLCASEVCPKEEGHAKVNGGGVNRIKAPMQFKFLGKAPFLCKEYHKKSVFLEYMWVAEHVRFGEHVPVGGSFAEAKMVGSFSMCSSYVGEFPEGSASQQLPEYEREQMIPVGKRPFLGSVGILQHNSSELPLRQKAHDLSENILSNVHLCSIFDTGAKMQISNHGQYISILSNCA